MASEWLREGDSKQERERTVAEPESTTRFSWQSAVKTCGSCKSCKITCSRRSSCGPCPAPCFLVSLLPPPRYLTSLPPPPQPARQRQTFASAACCKVRLGSHVLAAAAEFEILQLVLFCCWPRKRHRSHFQ